VRATAGGGPRDGNLDLLVVSPHLDDAVLSAWRVLARPGRPATVVTCFAGVPEPGTALSDWDRNSGASDAATLVQARRQEDVLVLNRLGVKVVHLDELDEPYRDEAPDDVLARLGIALAPHVRDADVVLAPSGLGEHPDHLLARQCVLSQAPHDAVWLYADLPYASARGWPGRIRHGSLRGRLSRSGAGARDRWSRTLHGLPLGRVGVDRLTDVDLAAKRSALGGYSSQLALLDVDAADGDLDPLRYEVMWRLRR